ncbi:MAG TPA: FtsX-like permease family protein [Thermodesulfobium narugense]|nr:MAG: hypothetical protein C0174_05835 [Thermodesulfobium narugense]HEM56021.1 FtsX-like permease family protein [Thermodesulfobium narugense]
MIIKILSSAIKINLKQGLKVFIMISGISLCILVITLVTSISLGARQLVNETLQQFGPTSIIVFAGGRRQPGQPFQRYTTMTLDDVKSIKDQISGIVAIDPEANSNMNAKYRAQNIDTIVSGATPSFTTAWDWNVAEGRFFTERENASMSRVAVIGTKVAKQLFQGENPLGKLIRIGTTPFTVIGVLTSLGTTPNGIDRDNRIVIPLNTMMKRMLNQTYITMMRIKFAPDTNINVVADEISTILRYNHKLTTSGLPDDFTIITPDKVMEFLNKINSTLNIFLVVSTIVAIIIGSVVVSNIMQASISEREKEIALRRAFGATKSLIVIQVFLEIFVISIIGSIFGATLGALLGIIMEHLTGIHVSISPLLFLVAFSISTIIALIAGIQPAIKASSYDPAAVLQR